MNAEQARNLNTTTSVQVRDDGAHVDIGGLMVTVRVRNDGRLYVWIDVPGPGPLVTAEGAVPLVVGVGEMTLYATDGHGRNPWHQVPAWGAP